MPSARLVPRVAGDPGDGGDRGTLGLELLDTIARLSRWATSRADFDVAPAQARLLAHVQQVGPARTGDLARADHCTQPTMTGQLHRLEQQGWVRRLSDPTDGRASLVEITDEGRRALGEVRAARERVIAPLLAQLSSEERQQLSQGLAVVQRLMTFEPDQA
ncbi:MAG TPA: MarR family transcriptional regulator [Segeticoccus sp.]|uniref:MarR family winged helix-turn-helix transcriptional regulator n=1 Tax=Segeticoccus sp. TaxID=2706531 RepID=UPI002D80E4CE|nr:MarR family transcriptional regulator [Segeticoccus sp.]HET8598914.1 MarR family transcriptional regulator [Segeticoccus sp.]